MSGRQPVRDLLALAVRAAHRGGEALLRRAGTASLLGHKSTETDPVTDADLASEEAITALLVAERPGDGLLGEEGAARAATSGLRWVIDPLDGTANYLYGMPHTAVSIACEQRIEENRDVDLDVEVEVEVDTGAGAAGGVTGGGAGVGEGGRAGRWSALVGVVYDPARGETFAALRGGGATLNGRPIRVNDPVALPAAMVATGFGYSAPSRIRQAVTASAVLAHVRDIRSHGSAALELCWVAAGRCDAYYEDELGRWDWAAGALIAAEAGARVSRLGTGVLAAGAALYPSLAGIVARPAGSLPGPVGSSSGPPGPADQGTVSTW